MNIKDEYIEKTKEYLDDLRKKINKKTMLKEEIKLLQEEIKTLKSRQRVNGSINFEKELGIKSNSGAKGIDDLIVTTDAQICCKESLIENKYSQIERIEHDIKMFELRIRELTEIEKEVINARYFDKTKNKSFRSISKKINYAKSYVARVHDDAIKELAYFVYGEDATYA